MSRGWLRRVAGLLLKADDLGRDRDFVNIHSLLNVGRMPKEGRHEDVEYSDGSGTIKEKLVGRQSVADQDLWAISKSLLPPISAGSRLVPEDA